MKTELECWTAADDGVPGTDSGVWASAGDRFVKAEQHAAIVGGYEGVVKMRDERLASLGGYADRTAERFWDAQKQIREMGEELQRRDALLRDFGHVHHWPTDLPDDQCACGLAQGDRLRGPS